MKLKTINLRENNLGVGLVELLVALLIVAGVAAAIMVSYVNLPAMGTRGNAESVLQQDAALALEQMAEEVRESLIDTSGAAVTEDPNVNPSTDRDQLTLPGGITYSLTIDGILQRNAENLLGDYAFKNYSMRVDNLNFADNLPATGVNTIDMSFDVTLLQDDAKVGTGIVVDTFNFNTEVSPRNR